MVMETVDYSMHECNDIVFERLSILYKYIREIIDGHFIYLSPQLINQELEQIDKLCTNILHQCHYLCCYASFYIFYYLSANFYELK